MLHLAFAFALKTHQHVSFIPGFRPMPSRAKVCANRFNAFVVWFRRLHTYLSLVITMFTISVGLLRTILTRSAFSIASNCSTAPTLHFQ